VRRRPARGILVKRRGTMSRRIAQPRRKQCKKACRFPREEVRSRLHLEAQLASRQGDRPEHRSYRGYKLRTPTHSAQELFSILSKQSAFRDSLCDRMSTFTLGQTAHWSLSARPD